LLHHPITADKFRVINVPRDLHDIVIGIVTAAVAKRGTRKAVMRFGLWQGSRSSL
jgi:hypothetical protein